MRFEQVPHRRDRVVGIIDKANLPIRDVYRMPLFWANNHIVSETTFNLDATTDKLAAIYRVFRTGTIKRITYGPRVGAVTTPSVVYKFSIQTVTPAASTSSFPQPSGTLFGTGTSGLYTHTSSYTEYQDGYISAPLDTPASVTLGDYIALVIEYDASGASPSGSNYLKVGLEGGTVQTAIHGFPIAMTNTGAGWVKGSNQLPILGYTYGRSISEAEGTGDSSADYRTVDDETWAAAPMGVITRGERTLSTSSTDKRRGTFWVQPIDAIINGLVIVARFQDASTDFDIELRQVDKAYNDTTDGVLIATQSFSSGTVSSDWSTDQYIWLPFPETKVRARTAYTLSLKPTTTDQVYTRTLWNNAASTKVRYFGSGKEAVTSASTNPNFNNDFRYTGYTIPLMKQVTNRRYW